MILGFVFLYAYCCFALRTNSYTGKLFFIRSYLPKTYERNRQRLYEYDESFNDLVDDMDTQESFSDNSLSEKEPIREHFDLSVNSVTICGRIGFIAEPIVFQNGVKCLRMSIATSDRTRSGAVKTDWHKVILYGMGNVDYIYSRARVGDRAMVIGQLKYFTPPNFDASGVSRPKISEVSVNCSRGGNTFILLPKNPANLSGSYMNDNQQIYPETY